MHIKPNLAFQTKSQKPKKKKKKKKKKTNKQTIINENDPYCYQDFCVKNFVISKTWQVFLFKKKNRKINETYTIKKTIKISKNFSNVFLVKKSIKICTQKNIKKLLIQRKSKL
jgi:hypothetical protein